MKEAGEIEKRIEEQRANYEVLIKIAQINPDLFREAENVHAALEALRWVLGIGANSGPGREE